MKEQISSFKMIYKTHITKQYLFQKKTLKDKQVKIRHFILNNLIPAIGLLVLIRLEF